LGSKMRKPTHFMSCREWRNKIGLLHRLAGPAIESTSGAKYWWLKGRYVSRDSGEQPSLTEVFLYLPPAKDFPGYEGQS
jgi:hypothetical protein